MRVFHLLLQDYWGVDGDTVVFVADPNTGNILNFNVGENVDLAVPRVLNLSPAVGFLKDSAVLYTYIHLRVAVVFCKPTVWNYHHPPDQIRICHVQNFWTRLASKYGNKFFWQEQGEASAMLNAVSQAPSIYPAPS